MNLVHIGLPKTATTTLQDTLFLTQTRYGYLGKVNAEHRMSRRNELIDMISFQDSLDYNPARAAALLVKMREKASAMSRPVLLSDEIFSVEGRADRRIVADRLHALFAPAKVLIVLREQNAMIQSMYLNDLRGTSGSRVSLETWLQRNYSGVAYGDRYRVSLDYDRLVRRYEDVFRPENVAVLLFEHLRTKTSEFYRTLSDLLDVPHDEIWNYLTGNVHNARMSRRHLSILRFQDRFLGNSNLAMIGRGALPRPLYESVRRLATGGRRLTAPPIPAGWAVRIAEQCAEGNSALANRRKLPLREFGYPLAGDGN